MGGQIMEPNFQYKNIALFRKPGSFVKIKEKKVRSVALWDVTKKCDLRCVHCYNYDKYMSSTHSAGRETTTKEAIDIIDKLADFGFNQIHFLGGEPLNRDDCLKLFAKAVSRGLAVSINSNGIRLTDEMMEQLIDVGVSQLAISLDGSDAESNDRIRGNGTFERIINNLNAAVKVKTRCNSDLQLGIVVTLTKPLLEEAGKTVAFFPLLDSLGINWLNYIFLYKNSKALYNANILSYPMSMALSVIENEVVEGMREYPNIYVQLDCRPLFGKYLNRKYGVFTYIHNFATKCSAGHKTWLIEADGKVHPCGVCSTPDYGLLAAEAGCFKYNPLNMIDVQRYEQVNESQYFCTFRKYIRSKNNYNKFTTCMNCEFFGEVCLPCLLYSADGPVHELKTCRIEECEWTKEKMKKFYRQQEMKIPQLCLNNIKIENEKDESIRISIPSTKVSVKLSGTGLTIWKLINGKNQIANLLNNLTHTYQKIPDRSILRREVVDFLYNLRDIKVLVLKGGD